MQPPRRFLIETQHPDQSATLSAFSTPIAEQFWMHVKAQAVQVR
jgi:hypothetical protein